ncbi:hypothetical protein SAMN04488029_2200 [Reichenbachiella faecimaris]|uniref:Uncharacterized protein n=1 Tax=Reichenbachiella faecimaris TaxID=692418 RepID=A0A1W2GDW1_REIFA|nr:hypothetical protein [Reichenbachiella faecimaris]SMD34835.1 hypothetical protein SAMN04488029_2200 [Reichenbachiella faecimaris]
MTNQYKNGEEYYNKTYLQFNFFIAVSLVPFGYLLLLKQSGQLISLVSGDWYLVVVFTLLLASAAIIFQTSKHFNSYLGIDKNTFSLRKKLDQYKSESLKKYLAFLLASLVCVCGLYLTASAFFIVGYIVSIILLSIKRPTLNTIIEDLKLSEEEQNILIEKKDIPFN